MDFKYLPYVLYSFRVAAQLLKVMKLFKNELSKAVEMLILPIALLFLSTIAMAMLSKNA
ncbi:MAG: hypothetical protein GY810_15390 [Aureispira sp.]|nr:hypothetical protein [Aureispira sp.]